jgi:hypothetical protein
MKVRPFFYKTIFTTALVIIIQTCNSSFAQKYEAFQGTLVYSIEMADTSLQKMFPPTTMTIYTNDTIVRIENETNQLGKQIIIKHLILNKSILLIQNGETRYAIQTDLSKEQNKIEKDTLEHGYIFKKKIGTRKIINLKANRMNVKLIGQKKSIEILYLKHFSPKYIDVFEGIPGLPVRYYINTEDGVMVYTLIHMEKKKLDRDLFGVPNDYKKVSFDQFLEEVMRSKK